MATNRVVWTGTAIVLAALAALAIGACDSGSWFGSHAESSATCTDCHAAEARAWENDSSHSLIYECEDCHAKESSDTGPGHRATPTCDQCHSEAAHPPAGFDLAITCRTCHDPHGSKNLFLVPATIAVNGEPVPVDFRNTDGFADYSYAEPGTADGGTNDLGPGQGLCEICHDQTRYYNQTGTGSPHYTERCSTCHCHAEAFAPPTE